MSDRRARVARAVATIVQLADGNAGSEIVAPEDLPDEDKRDATRIADALIELVDALRERPA